MTTKTIITPVAPDGTISQKSFIVEKSAFQIFLSDLYSLMRGTLAWIGIIALLDWFIL